MFPQAMTALELDGVVKNYGETTALDGVSLTVGEGEVFALVGPNGAGKTTLVRCATGTARPSAGSVRVLDGLPQRLDRDRIGVLPQDFTPYERLTPRELLGYYAGLYGDAGDVVDVLGDVGLGGVLDKRYSELSGGQKRRVCVATALVNDPDLLLLDEPTTGIDPRGRRELWRLVEGLAGGGTTVFLSTHYMEEAERLADRVGLLSDGALVEVGEPSDLVERYGGEPRLVVEARSLDEAPELGIDARLVDGSLVVEGVSPYEIEDVLDMLEGVGVDYDAFEWRQPGLEDVYLDLTGEGVGGDG